jgi:hypothetical protein
MSTGRDADVLNRTEKRKDASRRGEEHSCATGAAGQGPTGDAAFQYGLSDASNSTGCPDTD